MKLGDDFEKVLKVLEQERGISPDSVLDAVKMSLLNAYKKKSQEAQELAPDTELVAEFDPHNRSEIKIYMHKTVVDNEAVPGPLEVRQKDVRKKHPQAEIGSVVQVEVPKFSEHFSRYAAQVAKQAIMQKLREAEKKAILEEYKDKMSTIMIATVQRLEKNNVIVKLNNKAEMILPPTEQLHGDKYRFGDRIRVYLSEVKDTHRGQQLVISRSHPGLVRCLFELEIPEISDGTVVIKSIAREAGFRTKIAVASIKSNVDPVGACIGSRGSRIQSIIEELRGEKIDIVRWSDDLEQFITNALSPAKVISVKLSADKKAASILVPDDQLSLAIGRDGQNVRLAAHLTSCHLDISTESAARKKKLDLPSDTKVPGLAAS